MPFRAFKFTGIVMLVQILASVKLKRAAEANTRNCNILRGYEDD
jgi:hypothetical protein